MTRPVCLRGRYTLGGDAFTVTALSASYVIVVDDAGHQSQVHLATFHAHFVAVAS